MKTDCFGRGIYVIGFPSVKPPEKRVESSATLEEALKATGILKY